MGNIIKPRIVTSGLIAYLDPTNAKSYSGSGVNWLDMSGTATNGLLVGAPTYTIDASKNNFRMFTGKYADFGSNFNFTTQDFTFSIWVNIANNLSPINSGQGGILLFKGQFQQNGYYAQFSQVLPFGISFQTNQSGTVQGTTSNNVFSLNTWYNITFTRAGTSVRIYINGVDETAFAATHINPDSSANAFRFANYQSGAIDADYKVASFMVYDRAITTAEVLQNFNASKARFGY